MTASPWSKKDSLGPQSLDFEYYACKVSYKLKTIIQFGKFAFFVAFKGP